MISPDRLHVRAAAHVARAAEAFDPTRWSQHWLRARVDEGIREVLLDDANAFARGTEPGDDASSPYAFLTDWFALEPEACLEAATRFNGLPDRTRRIFFELVMDGKRLHECDLKPFATIREAKEQARAAMAVLFFPDDSRHDSPAEDRAR